ncbi:hypothetical protein [Parasitella parasitica]|uniref:Uncharacterized protein n=1 Tax=Parasitella parasitica TaxID=35722 RepID=A0A0B7NX74_9FUNG|nr:hypothetical protein [Parasitella parasitica]
MSDLSNDTYISDQKTPSLAAFVLDHQRLVSTYIGQFDKITDAKVNLNRKMKTAYFTKHPKRKRGPGLKINLEELLSSSKLDDSVRIEGNKTLEEYIKASRRRARKRLENENATKENESKRSSEVVNCKQNNVEIAITASK